MIAGLRELGKTVFLTTHYMEEAQRLADRVAIIARGEIVAEGRPDELGDRERRAGDDQLPAAGRASRRADLPGGRGRSRATPTASCDADHAPTRSQLLNALTGWALERRLDLDGLEVRRPSLEDIYLELTGRRRAGGGRA